MCADARIRSKRRSHPRQGFGHDECGIDDFPAGREGKITMRDQDFAYFIEKNGEATFRRHVSEATINEWSQKLPLFC